MATKEKKLATSKVTGRVGKGKTVMVIELDGPIHALKQMTSPVLTSSKKAPSVASKKTTKNA